MPHDRVGGKLWKHVLAVVDIGSRFKEAEPLSTKYSREIASAFEKIYERGPLKWPQLLQIDPGREFMGAVSRVMKEHGTSIRRGQPNLHRNQGLLERLNRTLAEWLFRHQYAVEMRLPEGERSVAWVRRLPRFAAAINNQVTRLTGLKPVDAIKKFWVFAEPATAPYWRPVGLEERPLPRGTFVRYLYLPGVLEGGTRRATDPVWSMNVFSIGSVMRKPKQPALYWLSNGPQRSFVREELMIVPPDTDTITSQTRLIL